MTIKESEAKHIRSATKAIIAGRSPGTVAAELNAAGARTSTGRPWTRKALKDVLTRPRTAGAVG